MTSTWCQTSGGYGRQGATTQRPGGAARRRSDLSSSSSRLLAAFLLFLAGPAIVLAQGLDETGDDVPESVPIQPEPAPPPPGEEVMRPTAHGIRLTRKMADGLARMTVRNQLAPKVSMDEEQQERLAQAIADRTWDLKQRYSGQAGRAIEHFYASLMEKEIVGDGGMSPEEAQEFSRTVGPGARIIQEFWEGLLEDARPILDPVQYGELEEEAEKALKMTRRFQEKMARWARGEVKENERIMEGFDEDNMEAEESGKSMEYIRAERSARWNINQLGPDTWRRFLNGAANVFKFDAEQKETGEEILREYSDEAKIVMTPEWKKNLLANRVQERLGTLCPEEPLDPWMFHLEQEYKRMVEPLEELGRNFRWEILSLATPQQRERVVEELRTIGLQHGMSAEELVGVTGILPEPQTQPEAN